MNPARRPNLPAFHSPGCGALVQVPPYEGTVRCGSRVRGRTFYCPDCKPTTEGRAAGVVQNLLEDDLDSPDVNMGGYQDAHAAERRRADRAYHYIGRFLDWLDEGEVDGIWMTGLREESKTLWAVGDGLGSAELERQELNRCGWGSCGTSIGLGLQRYNVRFAEQPPSDGMKVWP